MKKLAMAAMALALSGWAAAPVSAADLDPGCDSSWSGIYMGAHGGYVFGKGDYGGDSPSLGGFLGGGLAGYNHQFCEVVFGVEGDFGLGEVDGDEGVTNDFDIEPNGHLRARLGMPMDNVMPFLAAGLAIADMDVRDTSLPIGARVDSKVHFGLSIGAGLDVRVTDAILVRGEYLFDSYGSKEYLGGTDVDADTHTIRAAVIWQFNGL